MASTRKNYTAKLDLSADAERVWKALTDFESSSLYPSTVEMDLTETGEDSYAGHISFGGISFKAGFVPYDMHLSADKLRVGITLIGTADGCTAVMAASAEEDLEQEFGKVSLERFLRRLLLCCTDNTGSEIAAKKKQVQAKEKSTADPAPAPKKEKKKSFAFRRLLAALLILALAAGGVYLFVNSKKSHPILIEQNDGSPALSLEAALSTSVGDSKKEIERRFGRAQGNVNGGSLYISRAKNEYGSPAVEMLVYYGGDGTAEKICVLDLRNTETAVLPETLPYTAADYDSITAAAGCEPSLYRFYKENDNEVAQYHFGFADASASLSELWQGELWASVKDGSAEWHNGIKIDLADPLFVTKLQNSALSRQYSSYDEYLADYIEYKKCLEMTAQYSTGDCVALFGALEGYMNSDEIGLYKAYSPCTLADGSAAWSYTIGLQPRGFFALFSAVNKRVMNREGMLSGVPLESINKGTGFNELMNTVGLIPSCAYIDYSYILFGFGKYLGADKEQNEQFEFMAKLRLSDMVVENIYNNTEYLIDLA